MSAEQRTPPGRAWHVWLVGVLGGLWSVMGLVSFTLTQMRVDAVMSRFPPQQRAYFESFPAWSVAAWAIGVAGGVIGCLLLLTNRRAFPVLLASLLGTSVSALGGLFLLGGLQVMRETDAMGFTLLPVVIASVLAFYAWRQS